MNFSEIKQELAKKFEKMSYEDFKKFEHELLIMYANKHSKNMCVDGQWTYTTGVWIRDTESESTLND